MKSNIQIRLSELRQYYRANKELPTCASNDFIAIEYTEKDECGNNYFEHIDNRHEHEEIIQLLSTPVSEILRVIEWYAGDGGGVEYTTSRAQYMEETRNTFKGGK